MEQQVNLYNIDELVRVAKRENNAMRSYLYVNPLQGKHIPVSPSRALTLFAHMAGTLARRYKGKRLLVIGFAETATAIGAALAYYAGNAAYYMNTTREDVPGAEYLFFTESHSHATEQRLVKNRLGEVISDVDCVVFAEDEVTTGNTIEKLIRAITAEFDCGGCEFGIISILNSMSEARLAELEGRGIKCDFIQKIPPMYRAEEIDKYEYKTPENEADSKFAGDFRRVNIGNYWNSRIAAPVDLIREKAGGFAAELVKNADFRESPKRVLVLGTEEFMFPAMLAGKMIEEKFPAAEVRFHATTRSPIEVSDAEEYPLHLRKTLISLYDEGRRTFVYNLKKYDQIICATDADPIAQIGLGSLLKALADAGNGAVTAVQWREER